jgi:cytochrome c oxidase subunit IV
MMPLSITKAGIIVDWFMHLGSERPALVFTLIPALVFTLCLLFVIFPDAFRILHLGTHR